MSIIFTWASITLPGSNVSEYFYEKPNSDRNQSSTTSSFTPDSNCKIKLRYVHKSHTKRRHHCVLILAVEAFEKFSGKPHGSTLLAALLSLILNCSKLEFDSRHIQISSTAMGTKMAPNCVNVLMRYLQKGFLEACPLKPLTFKWFLNDVFTLWLHSEKYLLSFIENLNNTPPSIEFIFILSRD